MSVILTPKTSKAKSRINDAGNPKHWIVIRTAETVAFSDREGPWLYVRPDNNIHGKERWINENNDVDFIVQSIARKP